MCKLFVNGKRAVRVVCLQPFARFVLKLRNRLRGELKNGEQREAKRARHVLL